MERDIACDLTERASEHGQESGELSDAVTVTVPGDVGQRKLEFRSEFGCDSWAGVAQGGEGPDSAPKLQRQNARTDFREAEAVAENGVEPTRDDETEGSRSGMLHPCSGHNGSGAMLIGESDEGIGETGKFCADEIENIADLQDESRVDRILAGGTPVNKTSGILVVTRRSVGQSFDQRDCGVSSECDLGSEIRNIQVQSVAVLRDFARAALGNNASAGFGGRQSGLKGEHGAKAGLAGENLFERSVGEKSVEEVHALRHSAGVVTPHKVYTGIQGKGCARGLDPLEDDGDPLANADAHGAKSEAAFGPEQLVRGGRGEASATGAERMADGDSAAVGVNVRGIVGQAEFAENGERLRGEGLVEFDNVHLGNHETCLRQNFLRRGDGTHSHDPGSDAGGSGSDNASLWSEAELIDSGFGGHKEGAGTVVNAGGIAGSDRAFGFDNSFEFGESFERGVGARVLVDRDQEGVPFFLRNGNGGDFLGETTSLDGVGGAFLTTKGESILIGTRDFVFFGDDLAGLWHGVRTVLGFDQGIDETPADRGVFELGSPGERGIGFAEHKRSARHALDAAGNEEIDFAALDGT